MVDIIELLYRQYKHLRDETEKIWNEQNDIQLTTAEWYVINHINQGASTVPEIMKRMDITKQAVHKFFNGLEEKGIVQTALIKAPKTQRNATLTSLGYEVIDKSALIQVKIVKQIEHNIGNENYLKLKELLNMPWQDSE
ncbi:MarR family transcriptional regulator [Lysinibacillus sp. 2017]|uniref:MarR family transcriptional regulator n=1 Tax=unclassified Lysinibacillus TaxID=2636778 RepID=UPI000D529143|nr:MULTISPECIES: MarR family transcriptional regulator [unclassified Lysinibacillus]AWE08274.1 MarR family transcriptional regulator [Lysinibacillus sp. 2017]TGN36223.1 MarR family transcriptional regulator [Lysinibacillus sp. S2017]